MPDRCMLFRNDFSFTAVLDLNISNSATTGNFFSGPFSGKREEYLSD